MLNSRFQQQIAFIQEIDKLKRVDRRTFLLDGSRTETDAEHSWHLAMMALLLMEYAPTRDLDLLRVVKMALVHDVVEIDAGDTFLFDDQAAQDKGEREQRAADRIFALLPPDQALEFRALWDEFEARATPEANFALILDRLQPLLHNYVTEGKSWKLHGVTAAQVRQRWEPLNDAAPALWEYAQELIRISEDRGYLIRSSQL